MKKLLSKTYLRDVSKYELKFFSDNDDFYLVVKRIVKTDPKFITFKGLCLIDDGYYIVELLPKNENYAMRVFLNDKKEPIEYYFDISLENGIDEETKVPYYDDLFTDVIVVGDKVFVVDENELKDALKKGVIKQADFELANKTTSILVAELKAGTNRFKNLNLMQYLN